MDHDLLMEGVLIRWNSCHPLNARNFYMGSFHDLLRDKFHISDLPGSIFCINLSETLLFVVLQALNLDIKLVDTHSTFSKNHLTILKLEDDGN